VQDLGAEAMFRSLLGQRSVTCLLPEAWAIDPSSQNNSQQRFVSAMAVVQDTSSTVPVYGDTAHLRRHLTARATSKKEGTLILRILCILGPVAICALDLLRHAPLFSPPLTTESPTTHYCTVQHHVPIDPYAERMPRADSIANTPLFFPLFGC
jgi:hypothetical protein